MTRFSYLEGNIIMNYRILCSKCRAVVAIGVTCVACGAEGYELVSEAEACVSPFVACRSNYDLPAHGGGKGPGPLQVTVQVSGTTSVSTGWVYGPLSK